MTSEIYLYAAGVFILVVILKLIELSLEGKPYRYKSTKSLLTNGEKAFYKVLVTCVGDDYTVHCKVRLADILEPDEANKKRRNAAFWKTASKHIDFVIADSQTATITCGIELDDKSHQKPNRVERDNFVNDAFRTASIPLLRINAKSSYTAKLIEKQLLEASKQYA